MKQIKSPCGKWRVGCGKFAVCKPYKNVMLCKTCYKHQKFYTHISDVFVDIRETLLK